MRMPVIPRRLRLAAGILPASIADTTVGDLLLLTPILVFLLRGAHFTFSVPSLNASGYQATYCIFAAYITASKSNNLFTWLFGIPYERLVWLHQVASVAAAVLGGFHGYVSYNFGGDDDGDSVYSKAHAHSGETGTPPNLIKFLFDGQTNWSGTILLGAIIATVLLSGIAVVRRYAFNLWYLGHIVFGVTIVAMLFLHSVTSAVFVTAWWALDLLVRYAIMTGPCNKTQARLRIIGTKKRETMQPYEPAVELIVKKPALGGFEYNAGQFVRLAVPAISAVEFHPISISSAPDEKYITLHVRRLGDWTDQLVQLAEMTDYADVLLEGPYGAMSIDLEDDEKYKLVLSVSGGIGVTPCQSIGKDLLIKHRQQGRRLKKLNFVWAVRDLKMVKDIPPLLLGENNMETSNEIKEDYSQASPEFQRMMERSDYFRSSAFEKSLRLSSTMSTDSSEPKASSSTLKPQHHRRRPAVVQADIYCTQQSVEGDIERANETGVLPYNLHSGRPDLDEIFEEMKASAEALGETNIAVIGCGPASLMVALQEACRKHSASVVGGCAQSGAVFFDLHKEHFEL
ncbi:MAG: hypothetical protein SGILL_004569 [Bacillariaceae sp.]